MNFEIDTTQLIEVHVNGERRSFAENLTIAMLVEELGFKGKPIAVEVNQEISIRERHESHVLTNGDWVEIVSLVGGG